MADGIFYLKGDQLVRRESCITGKVCRSNILKERMTPLSPEKLIFVHSGVYMVLWTVHPLEMQNILSLLSIPVAVWAVCVSH